MSKCRNCGSYAINHSLHGRDGSDEEFCDVCFWRKRAETQQAEIERLKKRNNELFYTLKWLFEMTDDLDCEDYSRVDEALEGNQ